MLDSKWDFSPQIDLAVTLTIFVFLSRNILLGVPKKYHIRNSRFFEKNFVPISPKINQKIENNTVGRH